MSDTGKTIALIKALGAKISPEDIQSAADSWLEENITNPDSPPLDRSLSSSSAAAPADIVGDLKNEISDIYDDNITISKKYTTIAEENNYRLNESDGYKSSDSNYKLVKYPVVAGKTVKAVSDDRFQFSNSASVAASGTVSRVGDTYGAGTFYLTVPTGATYLIVSTPKTSAHAVYDYDGSKTYIEKTKYRISSASDFLVYNAYLDGNGKMVEQSGNLLYCTDFIAVKSGEKIKFGGKAYSSRSIFAFYTAPDPTANASSVVAGGGSTTIKDAEFTASADGYIRFSTNMANGGDYLCFVNRISDLDAMQNSEIAGKYTKPSGGIPSTDLTAAVQTSLGKADTAYQKPSGGIPASDIAPGVIPTSEESSIQDIGNDIVYKIKEDASDAYEKSIPSDAIKWDAKLISLKGKSYLSSGSAVVLSPSAVTSFDADSNQIESISLSSIVTSAFGGKMCEINGIADEINFAKQKAIKRCACVKISDLTVTRVTSWTHAMFRLSNTGGKKPSNGFMEGYGMSTVDQTSADFPDDSYYFPPNSSYIYIRDDSYTTEQTFLAAMGDRLVIYALETVTSTDITISDNIKIRAGGKIQFANTESLTVESEIRYFLPYENNVPKDVSGECMTLRSSMPTYYTEQPENPDDFEDDAYIDVKIESIPDGKHFMFFTDSHIDWNDNAEHSDALMQYIRRRKGIQTVIFGGDFINCADDKYLARQVLGHFAYKYLSAFGRDMLPVMGNHDTNLANQVGTGTESTKYLPFSVTQKVLFDSLPLTAHTQYERDAGKISDLSIDEDHQKELAAYLKLQYYYDDPARKIRYIILNSGNPSYGHIYDIFGYDDCRIWVDWYYDALRTTPTGYDVAICIHQLALAYSDYPSVSQSKYQYIAPTLAMGLKTKTLKDTIFTASSNANLNTWYPRTNYAYDFTNCNSVGKVFFVVGHSHCDCIGVATQDSTYYNRINYALYDGESTLDQTTTTTLNGCPIPIIYTLTDAYGRANDAPSGHRTTMANESVTEHAFDIFTLMDGTIKLTRIGAGEDREVLINA